MNALLICVIICSFIPITTLFYVCISNYSFPFSIFSSISIIIIFSFIVYLIYNRFKCNKISQVLEEVKLNNTNLQALCDNLRVIKHDNGNVIQAIQGFVELEDWLHLKKYIKDINREYAESTNLSLLNPSIINNSAMYGVLSSKFHQANELGITMNLEIFLDLSELNIKPFHISRIFGILLDNAIEATKECKEKVINIYMHNDLKSNRKVLIVENTYINNHEIDADKIFEKGFSTKPNNTGIGLWEVRKILKKYNNLNLFTSVGNTLFKQELEIYNN